MKKYMPYILAVILSASTCIAEEQDAMKDSFLKQRAMIDQKIREYQTEQMRLMDEWGKVLKHESYESTWDPLLSRRSRDVQSRRNRTDDKIDSIKSKIEEHKQEINNLKLKREELNLKVIEKYGTIPDWWKEEKPK